MAKLTHERLQELLSYDPDTGIFAWLKSTSPRVSVGDRAGVVASNGRRYISIDGEKFMAHRLAWFFTHGEWPEGDIKQKNEDFDDCRADNLEDVSRSVASRSRSLDGRNKSGYRGVSQERSGKWVAFITREYKQIRLGAFETPEEASAVYERAAAEMESAVTPEKRAEEAAKSAVRRRLRVAWAKLQSSAIATEWPSYEDFSATVPDVPPRHSVVAIDTTLALGPLNFQCAPDLSTGFDLRTQEGRVAYNKAHRQANPDQYRNYELRKSFGIGLEEKQAILDSQSGVCAICERDERAERNGKTLALAVDHCHTTGKIRGVLCGNCNKALGKFEDNPDFLRNAIIYLAKHSTPSVFACEEVGYTPWILEPDA